jgi:hypothetical protein
VTPASGCSCASICAPKSVPSTSIVLNHPSCWRLKLSKNAGHSLRGISRVGMVVSHGGA